MNPEDIERRLAACRKRLAEVLSDIEHLERLEGEMKVISKHPGLVEHCLNKTGRKVGTGQR